MIPRRRSVALIALLLAGCSSDAVSDHEYAAPDVSENLPAPTNATTTTAAPAVRRTSAPVTLDSPIVIATTSTAPTTTIAATTTTPATTTPVSTPATTLATATPTATVTTIAAAVEVAEAPPSAPQPQPQSAPPSATPAPTAPRPAPAPTVPPGPQFQEGLALGTIEIPRLGLSKTLYEGISIPTLDQGPGHWPGTPLPGQLGNVVVGGHRTSHGHPFRHLEQLVPGDEVIFTTAAGRFVYHVFRTDIVTPDDIWITNQPQLHMATLFACHPAHSTTHRIVVFLVLSV